LILSAALRLIEPPETTSAHENPLLATASVTRAPILISTMPGPLVESHPAQESMKFVHEIILSINRIHAELVI
jgi:hypothetical protein